MLNFTRKTDLRTSTAFTPEPHLEDVLADQHEPDGGGPVYEATSPMTVVHRQWRGTRASIWPFHTNPNNLWAMPQPK